MGIGSGKDSGGEGAHKHQEVGRKRGGGGL